MIFACLGWFLAECCLFWVETGNSLQSPALYWRFSTEKSPPAREKSSYEDKPFAAHTPPRKRGYVEDFTLKSVNAYRNKLPLRNFKNSRFVLSLKLCCEIAARQARGWGCFLSKSFCWHALTFMPCHAAVCVNLIFAAQVLTFSVISQSTGLTFPPGSLTRDDFAEH